jgi:coenzyme F420-dependent glucose-6-phosphate dehydrogenase
VSRVGYHCSHEQHAPSVLLANACAAEGAGFADAMCSDHFAPWSERDGQGQSGHAWTWLGAALQATRLTFGTVTAPGQRYHPAIHAQTIATLAEMFPGRVWVAFGSGEAVNEHVTGDAWPPKPQRTERLRECIDVIRALLAGEEVTHDGRVRVHEAKLYSRPATPPPLIGAALSSETAAWIGDWADGMITVWQKPEQLVRVIDAFRDSGGGGKPIYVQAPIAWGRSEQELEQVARTWAHAAIGGGELKADLTRPAYFDAAAQHVPLAALRETISFSTSVSEHIDRLGKTFELGIDRVYVHAVGSSAAHQEAFFRAFGRELARL